jgi:excisionase family DNA binding protein
MESTLIHNLNAEEINNLFVDLKKELSEIKQKLGSQKPDEYLTRSEVAKFFKCDLSTVHNWTVKGKLKAYYTGSRVYYRRDEIQSALIPINNNAA